MKHTNKINKHTNEYKLTIKHTNSNTLTNKQNNKHIIIIIK